MKSLQDECLLVVAKNLHHPYVGANVCRLHRNLKTALLERLLWHEIYIPFNDWRFVMRAEFFENFTHLYLPRNKVLKDKWTSCVATSGCKLQAMHLVVPLIKRDERYSPLSGRGVSALFADQDQLEYLKLVWCINFKADVLTRIRSDFLRTVDISGDAVCRCFEYNNVLRDAVHLYQRDVSFLAISNPTITKLCLDGIILDINDCFTLFSALADSLEHLEIKVVRYYAFCQRTHAFYGRDFVPFLELLDRTCRRLRYLSCFALQTDVQNGRQLVLKSPTLETLCLEGHVFLSPLLLPSNLRKLKLSINGYESEDHFRILAEQLYRLEKFYVKVDDEFVFGNERGFESLFTYLGSKLVSVTNVSPTNFSRISYYLNQFCENLKELSVVRALGSGAQLATVSNGSKLLPLFEDETRASKLRHLHLGLENLSQVLLNYIADQCTSLKTLDLAYCRTVDDMILKRLSEKCGRNLKVLELSLCLAITDAGVVDVARNCPNLEEITMFQTNVGDKSAIALANFCPRLRFCGVSVDQVSRETQMYLKNYNIESMSS